MAAQEPAEPASAAQTTPDGGLLSWLDARSGYRSLVSHWLKEPVQGGPRFAYVFGSLLLLMLLSQALTGVLMMAFYAPSATDAWASVAYLQDQVRLGWFVRGMHSAGASVLVIGMVLHLLQVTLYGAYRAPRELNLWTGLVLLMLVMGFALTGYLLPWDQKGYWATQVATTLLGAVPLIGPALQTILQGGSSYGNLTLTHFYALHVFVLPALLVTMVVLHLVLFRRHGVTPRWDRSSAELADKTAPFWPRQALYDLGFSALVFGAVAIYVAREHGAELAAPADPSVEFDARPEWYFLPLYQLLKYFPGYLEVVAALGVPLLFFAALALLPWLDRAPTREPKKRWAPLFVCIACLAGAGSLGAQAAYQDAHNPRFAEHAAEAKEQALRARKLALLGVPAEGGVAVYLNDPLEQGRRLFSEHCTQCHRLGRMGPSESEQKGPNLSELGSREWLAAFLVAPQSSRFFGHTKLAGGMKAVKLPPAELTDLVEYVYSLGGRKDAAPERVQRGALLFQDKNCDLCHERDGKTGGQGPNLLGYGSVQWLRRLISGPDSALFYGDKNDMPSFGKKLSADELDRLAAYLGEKK
jgi:ubiquinol-cytochrome c reductase cytochrome b subunit